MGEEDVKIPITLEVDKKELSALKDDIDQTFKKVQNYEKSFSTKKEPFKLVDVAKTESDIQAIISKIGSLQKDFEIASKNTPGNNLLQVQSQIKDIVKENTQSIKEQASYQAKFASNTKQAVIQEQKAKSVQAEMAKLQKQYEADRANVDTSKRGSKSELRALEQQHKAEMSNLNDRYQKANTAAVAYRGAAAAAKQEVDSIKEARAGREQNLSELRASASELGKLAKSEDYVKQREEARVGVLKKINAELAKQRDLLLAAQEKAESQLAADQAKTGRTSGTSSKHDKAVEDQAKKEAAAKAKIAADAEKEAVAKTNAQIQALNKEKATIKQSAAQYYYKLRAIKMLGFVVNSANAAMDRFGKTTLRVATKSLNAYLKLIPGVNALKKAVSGATSEQKKLNRETNKAAKSNLAMDTSLKSIVKNILTYGLGIRSLFTLFNKLRKAVIDGLGSMSKQISAVNDQMSSIVTSLNFMKASITAGIQPLLNALAPALERLSAILAEVTYQIASFIATFTGQSVVYKAIRTQTDYAASLDKTGKSAKKAKKELAGFDELNVLHTQDDSGTDVGGMAWDTVELSKKAQDFANMIKDIFKKLVAPVKAAWDKIGRYVVLSWKYAADQIKALAKDMARDFWRVWEEYDTQKIFENMFRIMGDIGRIIGNVAKKFREAWNEADNGYRILASIRDIVGIIVQGIADCTSYTIKWSDSLTFIPLLTALADNMQSKLVPAIQNVVDLFVTLYQDVLSKIVKDIIEKGLPQVVNIAGNITTAVGNIAKNINIAISDSDRGVAIVEHMESLIQTVADAIEDCSEKTVEWAAHLDFAPLFESFDNFLINAKPLIDAISSALSNLWNNTLLPFYEYLIQEGFPKLLDALGEITGGDWSGFVANAESLTQALEPFFELTWETLVEIIKDLGGALKDFLGSDELGSMIEGFKEWATDADPEKLASKIERLVVEFVALKSAANLVAKVVLPVITGFMTIQNVFKQGAMFTQIGKISADVAKLSGEASTATVEGTKFITFMDRLAGALANPATALEQIVTKLGKFGEILTKFVSKLAEFSTALGILTAITGVFTALKAGFDMMENGFSVAGEVLLAFGAVLTSVGLIIAGVATWPALLAGAVVALIANLGAFGDDILKWVFETGNTVREKIGEVFSNLGFYIGAAIHTLIVTIIDFLKNLPSAIGDFITQTDWKQFGINILEGIFAIFLSIGELISWIGTAIANLISGFIKGLCTGFDMHSPSKKMEPYGKMILEGLLQGIIGAISSIGTWVDNHIVTPIMSAIRTGFGIVGGAASKLKTIGGNLMTGLQNGISALSSSVKSTVSSFASGVVSIFSSRMSSSSLWATGYNVVVGLINGMVDRLNRAYQVIREGCSNIINIARNILRIGSPSKVFEEIGEYTMEGMTEGLEDGAKDTEKTMDEAMNSLIPDINTSDDFSQNFLDNLSAMKQDAVDIITAMVAEMSDAMSGMNNIFSLGNINIADQLSKLDKVSVPNIAQGKTLPATPQFVTATTAPEQDYSKLASVLSSAIIDAFNTSRYNNTNDNGDTVIQIDGREVFRAVKKQNQMYQKSTGKSAF